MSYVDANLGTGEKVEYRGKVHWGIGLPYFLVAGLFFLVGGREGAPIGAISLLIGIAKFLLAKITCEYAITNRRVVLKKGFISRHTTELNLRKVESASVSQGIFGRILGYGSLTVRGSGGTAEKYPNLAQPTEFRRALNDATERAEVPAALAPTA